MSILEHTLLKILLLWTPLHLFKLLTLYGFSIPYVMLFRTFYFFLSFYLMIFILSSFSWWCTWRSDPKRAVFSILPGGLHICRNVFCYRIALIIHFNDTTHKRNQKKVQQAPSFYPKKKRYFLDFFLNRK